MVIVALAGPIIAGEGVSGRSGGGAQMVFRAVRGSEDRRWSYSGGGIISGGFKFGA